MQSDGNPRERRLPQPGSRRQAAKAKSLLESGIYIDGLIT